MCYQQTSASSLDGAVTIHGLLGLLTGNLNIVCKNCIQVKDSTEQCSFQKRPTKKDCTRFFYHCMFLQTMIVDRFVGFAQFRSLVILHGYFWELLSLKRLGMDFGIFTIISYLLMTTGKTTSTINCGKSLTSRASTKNVLR